MILEKTKGFISDEEKDAYLSLIEVAYENRYEDIISI